LFPFSVFLANCSLFIFFFLQFTTFLLFGL